MKTQGSAWMDRVTTGLITPAWRRERLLRALVSAPDLAAARSALARHDWRRAHIELSRHFARAPQRFVVGPATKATVIESVRRGFPGSVLRAAAEADRILAGEYDLLGYKRLRFDPAGPAAIVDWHLDPVHERRAPRIAWSAVRFLEPSCGDHKIIWELNRHQHWLALGRAFWLTGDTTYRDRSIRELHDWLDANPPRVGINWASMLELALRSLSWVWALALFVDEEHTAPEHESVGHPWTVDLLLALDLHLAHIERHLSHYFSPNTHLLGEALALYVCGLALPELAAGARRAETGRRILLAEISRQIAPDGGHLERSTHYHRYALDFYLLALIVARINRDPVAGTFELAVSRLASAARLLADDRGRTPHIGDDDGGMLLPMTGRSPDDLRDSLAAAALLLSRPALRVGRIPELVSWLLAHEAVSQKPAPSAGKDGSRRARLPSGALNDTGYYVSRTAASDHLVIDGGLHGYRNAGHAHADALSLTLSVRGQPLLIDPGTGCYTSDAAVRERFRSTALHNTVTIDGKPSSVTNGPFHWSHVANSRVLRWQTAEAFDYFDGAHDGYHPLTHRRCVLALHGDLLIVADLVDGRGAPAVATHWHIDPSWSIHIRGSRASFRRGGQHVDLVVSDGDIEVFTADRHVGLGWHSPAYGRVEPSTTLRVVRRATLPLSMVTVIGLNRRNRVQGVTLVPATSIDGRPAQASAFRIARDSSLDYVLISSRSAGAADAAGPSLMRIGGVDTDARMLFYSSTRLSVSKLAFVDGAIVRTVASDDVRLEMPCKVPYYFADFASTPLTPPDQVRWQKRDPGSCVASPVS